MKKFIISFLLLSALSGCSPAPVPSTSSRQTILVSDYTRIYERAKNYSLVVEYYITELEMWDVLGSAFVVVHKGKQYIVTAKHVCKDNLKLRIKDSKGNLYPVVGFSVAPDDDIGTFNIEGNLKFKGGLSLAKSNPKIGSEVYHIGNPLGTNWFFINGVVSQYESTDMICSASLAPGSSGGMLINAQGQVVGIAVAVLPDWRQFNYYEPVESISKFLK